MCVRHWLRTLTLLILGGVLIGVTIGVSSVSLLRCKHLQLQSNSFRSESLRLRTRRYFQLSNCGRNSARELAPAAMAPASVPSFQSDARKCLSDSSRRQVTSCAVPERKPWSVDETLVEAARREDGPAQKNNDRKSVRNLCDFSDEIFDSILAKLDYKTLFQVKAVSKLFKARIEDDGYNCWRESQQPREARFTGLHFYVRNDNVWRCAGYDLDTQTWMKLPPFAMLPRLDTNLFKDHSICGAGGLLCVYVSAVQSSSLAFQEVAEKMVVLNPLTGGWRELPPLNHPRNPVLLQMVVASTGDSFKIIVAGIPRTGDEHLSKITEVFDSRTSMWTVTEDVPGPVFALNEHQNGAYMNGFLYCVAFLDGDRGWGILAYSVDEGKWLPHLACPLRTAANLNIMQVSNINGEIVAFSEIEHNPYNPRRTVEHRIDILQNAMHPNSGEGPVAKWRNVMTEAKVGSQSGLQIYPEYTCLPFGEGRLCIFNSIAHTGVIYDMTSGNRTGDLSAPSWDGSGEMNFCGFNPPAFLFEPSFRGNLKLELTNSSANRVRLK